MHIRSYIRAWFGSTGRLGLATGVVKLPVEAVIRLLDVTVTTVFVESRHQRLIRQQDRPEQERLTMGIKNVLHVSDIKEHASSLGKYLKDKGAQAQHGLLLDGLSRLYGARDYNSVARYLAGQPQPEPPEPLGATLPGRVELHFDLMLRWTRDEQEAANTVFEQRALMFLDLFKPIALIRCATASALDQAFYEDLFRLETLLEYAQNPAIETGLPHRIAHALEHIPGYRHGAAAQPDTVISHYGYIEHTLRRRALQALAMEQGLSVATAETAGPVRGGATAGGSDPADRASQTGQAPAPLAEAVGAGRKDPAPAWRPLLRMGYRHLYGYRLEVPRNAQARFVSLGATREMANGLLLHYLRSHDARGGGGLYLCLPDEAERLARQGNRWPQLDAAELDPARLSVGNLQTMSIVAAKDTDSAVRFVQALADHLLERFRNDPQGNLSYGLRPLGSARPRITKAQAGDGAERLTVLAFDASLSCACELPERVWPAVYERRFGLAYALAASQTPVTGREREAVEHIRQDAYFYLVSMGPNSVQTKEVAASLLGNSGTASMFTGRPSAEERPVLALYRDSHADIGARWAWLTHADLVDLQNEQP